MSQLGLLRRNILSTNRVVKRVKFFTVPDRKLSIRCDSSFNSIISFMMLINTKDIRVWKLGLYKGIYLQKKMFLKTFVQKKWSLKCKTEDDFRESLSLLYRLHFRWQTNDECLLEKLILGVISTNNLYLTPAWLLQNVQNTCHGSNWNNSSVIEDTVQLKVHKKAGYVTFYINKTSGRWCQLWRAMLII